MTTLHNKDASTQAVRLQIGGGRKMAEDVVKRFRGVTKSVEILVMYAELFAPAVLASPGTGDIEWQAFL